MKRHYWYLLLAAIGTVNGTGCSSGLGLSSPYSSGPREMMTSRWRDHVWSNRAYETKMAGSSRDRAFESDFRLGFIAGYQSVSQGGDGTVPAMPPRKYWGPEYLSPEGQTKAKAWFEGYPEGVRAAQADGIDAYRDIYVSQLLEDLEGQVPGMNPEVGRHMETMPIEDRLPLPMLPASTSESAPPLPPSYNQPVSYVAPQAPVAPAKAKLQANAGFKADNLPAPIGFVDFATYQAAPKQVPTAPVPVIRPGVPQ